eukprot:Blabericola_migrator_1__627@NODE_1156_length_5256_cov_104_579881_g787_i0_p2_GENE_NODE_1156_length_5256_cov_104_579881_g787_i0NODE_1156_length_5256_cov_104_579881_g787_i0_p2_ORF_typecomplete_len136_score13_17_NODE_1156_length_5256_cov_104_579881_g787_i039446
MPRILRCYLEHLEVILFVKHKILLRLLKRLRLRDFKNERQFSPKPRLPEVLVETFSYPEIQQLINKRFSKGFHRTSRQPPESLLGRQAFPFCNSPSGQKLVDAQTSKSSTPSQLLPSNTQRPFLHWCSHHARESL